MSATRSGYWGLQWDELLVSQEPWSLWFKSITESRLPGAFPGGGSSVGRNSSTIFPMSLFVGPKCRLTFPPLGLGRSFPSDFRTVAHSRAGPLSSHIVPSASWVLAGNEAIFSPTADGNWQGLGGYQPSMYSSSQWRVCFLFNVQLANSGSPTHAVIHSPLKDAHQGFSQNIPVPGAGRG